MNGRLCSLDKAWVMAIVNLTPDSFYAPSRQENEQLLLQRVENCLREGADIIDLGACSTRPGAPLASQEEELRRLLPALELIRKHYPDIFLSVDTFRAKVAQKAVDDFQVAMINDVSAGELDDAMFETVASLAVPYVLTHSAGVYAQHHAQTRTHEQAQVCGQAYSLSTEINQTESVLRYLAEKLARLRALGVADVLVDPGFGFGKSVAENYALLRRLSDFKVLDAPLLVGLSRKRMAYEPLQISADEALNATSVLHTLALQQGAHILRVHDVKAAVECVKLMQLYNKD